MVKGKCEELADKLTRSREQWKLDSPHKEELLQPTKV